MLFLKSSPVFRPLRKFQHSIKISIKTACVFRLSVSCYYGITESKVDNSTSDSEVEIPGYCILQYEGGVAYYVRQDLCFNLRSTAMGDIEGIFFGILCPKTKPIFDHC